MTRVLYIAGYGRSGSTVLGTILGAHPDVIHVGEVRQLLAEWNRHDRRCSCGERYAACPFWQDVFAGAPPGKDLLHQQYRIERFISLPRILSGFTNGEVVRAYQHYRRTLFEFIRRQSQKQIVLDSSKSTWLATGRFLALNRFAGEEIFVIHVVRNGLAVTESQVLRGRNSEMEVHVPRAGGLTFRTAIGWWSANLMTSWLSRKMPDGRYLVVRYEDLVTDPTSVLEEIGQFCHIDTTMLRGNVIRGEAFSVGPIVAGNRLRFASEITLKKELRSDYGSRLTAGQRLIFRSLNDSLQRRYGYVQ